MKATQATGAAGPGATGVSWPGQHVASASISQAAKVLQQYEGARLVLSGQALQLCTVGPCTALTADPLASNSKRQQHCAFQTAQLAVSVVRCSSNSCHTLSQACASDSSTCAAHVVKSLLNPLQVPLASPHRQLKTWLVRQRLQQQTGQHDVQQWRTLQPTLPGAISPGVQSSPEAFSSKLQARFIAEEQYSSPMCRLLTRPLLCRGPRSLHIRLQRGESMGQQSVWKPVSECHAPPKAGNACGSPFTGVAEERGTVPAVAGLVKDISGPSPDEAAGHHCCRS